MMECIVRLYKLNLLPESILLMEAEDPEAARRRIPRPSNKARNSSAGSMLSRAISSLISLEGADSGPPGEASMREVEATQRTVSCLNACRVEDIFADSKFLRAESLHELVKAIMWASGPIKRVASSGEESDTAQASFSVVFCCRQYAATHGAYVALAHTNCTCSSVYLPCSALDVCWCKIGFG